MSEKSDDGSGKSNSSPNGNGSGWKTTKEGLEEACQRLSKLNVAPKKEEVAVKKPPGTYEISSEKITTNILGVRLSSINVYRYDVTVTGFTRNGKKMELAKQSLEDYTSVFRRTVCFEVYKMVCANDRFHDQLLYYNGQKILYSLAKLKLIEDVEGEKFFFEYDGRKKLGVDITGIEFTIKEVRAAFTLNDMTSLLKGMREVDSTLLQFIDIATSQYPLLNSDEYVAYNGGRIYLLNPTKYGFTEADDCPNLSEDGKFVAVGARKSSAAVEGPKGRGGCNVAVLLDTSKTAFHLCQPVINKALLIYPMLLDRKVDPLNLKRLREQFIGLFAEKKRNGNSYIFQITQISSRNALDVQFVFEGLSITVAEYYKRRYNIELQYPDLPLLVSCKAKGQERYFPMELCSIIGKQRVKQRQQTANQLKEMRKACVVPPFKRMENNSKIINALHLTDKNNSIVSNAGMTIIPKPLTADARRLPPPTVFYGSNTCVRVDPERMWSIGRNSYIVPASLRIWAIYVIADKRERVGELDVRNFVIQLMNKAKSFGMKLNEPADMQMLQPDKGALEETIYWAKKNDCSFLFFLQSDVSPLHDAIKYFERKYEIITQDLKISTFLNVVKKGKWQTLENIVHKLNVKLGGLNYAILPPESWMSNCMKKGRLVIGFSMAHPDPPGPKELAKGSSSVPSVVGYAANTLCNDCEFVGDFGFQDARRTDNVFLVDVFVTRIVQQYRKNHSSLPSEVVIYRSGVSEGQFGVLLDFEMPLIRKGLLEANCDPSVKVTLIVVSRMHNVRLVPKSIVPSAKPVNQNCKPGTVLDTQLVHPRFSEFYLNSHQALQGTAKVPRYTVIVDDSSYSMDDLEMMTYALCYCHQIVSLPTSVPSPLYIAARYAERGRRVMMERCGFGAISGSDSKDRGPGTDLRGANTELPYFGSVLAETRINA